jgi:hypothetical protein
MQERKIKVCVCVCVGGGVVINTFFHCIKLKHKKFFFVNKKYPFAKFLLFIFSILPLNNFLFNL